MLWPRIAEIQAEQPRRLTIRRIGWLEAVSAPCLYGGEETRETLGAELCIVHGPEWQARRIVAGNVWEAALLAWLWRPRDARAAAAALRDLLDRELWAPARFVREGDGDPDPGKRAYGNAWRFAVAGVRHGFGHPSRRAKNSVWDASAAEVISHCVCAAELDRVAEFEARDEVDALLARQTVKPSNRQTD